MTGTADTAGAGVQVLVAGAGPVGLTAALELARRGVRVRVVDAAAGPAGTSRALATHARTLEIYDQLGLIEEIFPRGQQVRAFTLHQNGHRLARMDADYSRLPTRYGLTLMVDQVITEEVLRTALSRQGVEVEWGTRLVALEQDAGQVTVTLTDAGGATSTVCVPWLVGCDGGHSTVRKQLGLRLIGDSSETWLIADAQVRADRLPQNSIHWLRTGSGTVMAVPFPEPGRWRLLDTADAGYDGDAGQIAARFEAKLAAGLGCPVQVSTPTWVSVFTIQQRMIPGMRAGRCFVAGDAAHVHSPASGQGMNTGIQDAYNLAWKLAMVVAGRAGDELLDSYSAERVPVGEALLGSTSKATSLITLRSRFAAMALPVMFGVVRTVKPLKSKIERKIMGGMSALPLSYAASPVTHGAQSYAGAGPRPGERLSQVDGAGADSPGWQAVLAELRDPRWSLLVGAGAAAAAPGSADWLSVRVVEGEGAGALPDPGGRVRADLGLHGTAWVLVRPDGYVAARGGQLGAGELAPALATAGIRLGSTASIG